MKLFIIFQFVKDLQLQHAHIRFVKEQLKTDLLYQSESFAEIPFREIQHRVCILPHVGSVIGMNLTGIFIQEFPQPFNLVQTRSYKHNISKEYYVKILRVRLPVDSVFQNVIEYVEMFLHRKVRYVAV